MVKIPRGYRRINHRTYIFGDFDRDGTPNADDRRPFDPKITRPAQEVNLTDELRAIRRHNLTYKPLAKATAKQMHGKYRIKGVYSTIGKMRKMFLEKEKVGDIGGVMVKSKNFSGVKEKIGEVRRRYTVKRRGFQDYYAKPKGGYYIAQHITILKKGKPIEIQSKTRRQASFHIRAHPFYKTYETPSRARYQQLRREAFKLRKADMR